MNNSHQKDTSLFEAIFNQDLSKIKEIINEGYDVNQALGYTEDLTPLIQAINLGLVEIVSILLDAGADVHLYQYPEDTPLGLATSSNNVEIVKLLLKAGAKPNFGGIGGDPLDRAVAIGSVDLVKILIDAGANINAGYGRWTPLMTAANQGDFEIVKFLVETGRVHINAKNENGETALDKAKYWGYQEIIDYLLPWAYL